MIFLAPSSAPDEDTAAEVPHVFTLSQNAPNPFNPSTVIRFDLAVETPVRLGIYSAAGQKVRELASGRMGKGRHTIAWDGRDDAGTPVSSGVYLFRLEAGGRSEAKRMLLLR